MTNFTITRPLAVYDLSILLNAAYFVLGDQSFTPQNAAAAVNSMIAKAGLTVGARYLPVLAIDSYSWRRNYLSDYKAGRPDKELYYEIAASATYMLINRYEHLSLHGMEADDFAAVCSLYAKDYDIVLVSSDNDWRLLSGLKNVLVYNRKQEVYYTAQNYRLELVSLILRGSHNGIHRSIVSGKLTDAKLKAILATMDACKSFSIDSLLIAVAEHKLNVNHFVADNWYYIVPDLDVLYTEVDGLADYLEAKNIFKKV